jgi:cytochrome o ubiquinol oxidase subunit 2
MARKKISKKSRFATALLPIIAVLVLLSWYLRRHTVAVLSPAGEIAQKERNLIVVALLLSAIVVLPVFAMTIAIVLKYRESNHEKKYVQYTPDWDHNRWLESLWWGIPCVIILVLSVITWNSSHALDPYKPLVSNRQPLTVQVICMDWKWLFIYPQQHIASVNLVEMPVDTPVNFQITSDAVMNSFWIPQLGGQIYAMPGMVTQLHLMADRTGSFFGSPANIAGAGFARMDFSARSVSQADFNSWQQSAEASPNVLTMAAYHRLKKPSENNPVTYYSLAQNSLYNDVVMNYMMPAENGSMSGSGAAEPSDSNSISNMRGMYTQ